MRIIIHYLKGIPESEELAQRALASLTDGWECEMRVGFTVYTAPAASVMEGSQLSRYPSWRQRTKIACLMNHVRFWREVVAANEPMVFAEHDARCLGEPPKISDLSTDVTHLADTAAQAIRKGGLSLLKTCYLKNPYRGANIMQGTAAYAVTPIGAQKLLDAFNRNGAEQSDFIINDSVVSISHRDLFDIEEHTLNSSAGGVVR